MPIYTEDKQEQVHHPSHYLGKKGYEAIDVIEAFDLDKNFCVANAVKYLLRAGRKENQPEQRDLEKARWYIERRLMQLRTIS